MNQTELEPELAADGWRPIRPSAFVTLVGPFYQRMVEGRAHFCFRVGSSTTTRKAGRMAAW